MTSKVLKDKINTFIKKFKNADYPNSKTKKEVLDLIDRYFIGMIDNEEFLINQIDNVLTSMNDDYYKKSMTSVFNLNFGSENADLAVEIEYMSNYGRWSFITKSAQKWNTGFADDIVKKSDENTTYHTNNKGSKTFINSDSKLKS